MTNGSNHWILLQPTRPTRLINGQGTKVLFVATSDCLPSHPTKKVGEPQTAVSPLLGLISVAYRWIMPDDWLFLYSPQVRTLVVSTETDRGYQSKCDCVLKGKDGDCSL